MFSNRSRRQYRAKIKLQFACVTQNTVLPPGSLCDPNLSVMVLNTTSTLCPTDGERAFVPKRHARRDPPRREAEQHLTGRARQREAVRLRHQRPPGRL